MTQPRELAEQRCDARAKPQVQAHMFGADS
jgi:hypothetical protein